MFLKTADTPEPDWGEISSLSQQFLRETVYENEWIPWKPHPKQRMFLACPLKEALFGGAAGGAKSVAMLMAAAQYVTRPGYNALLLRKTLPMLELPGGLIDISKKWWLGTSARWSEQKKNWTFPSGALIQFGYLENQIDTARYQGSNWDFCGFDELTQFLEAMYRYLFSRLRRDSGSNILPRMRATANPGGIGHEWVKRRFISGREGYFIPSKLEDNPSLDAVEYESALAELDPVTRAQLRRGDWDIRPEGNLFKRDWFKTIRAMPANVRPIQSLRFWDLAATVKKTMSDDPDHTVGVKIVRVDKETFVVADVIRMQGTPQEIERAIRYAARRDGHDTQIRMEQEGGSSGKIVSANYARVLEGYDFRGIPSHQDKVTRAQATSAASERGDILILEGKWNHDFIDEVCAFPAAGHDDQVDAFCGAFNALTRSGSGWTETSMRSMFSNEDDNYEVIER